MSLWSAGQLLVVASARNRVRKTLARLREPRYVIGAALVALYFFNFLGRAAVGRPGRPLPRIPFDVLPFIDAGLFGTAVVVLGVGWIFGKRLPLAFTEADVQFLFPAPLTRRAIVQYKLALGLLRIGFGAGLSSFFFARSGLVPFWRLWPAAWLAFGIVWMHLAGAALTRSAILRNGRAGLRRRVGTLAVLAATLGILAVVAARRLPPLPPHPDAQAVGEYVSAWLATPPLAWLVAPVRALVRLAVAPSAAVAGKSLLLVLGVAAAHWVWVVRTDAAFEESALESAERRAQRLEARRQGRRGPLKGRMRSWLPLRSTGRPEVALAWKNAIACQRLFAVPLVMVVVALLVPVGTVAVAAFPAVRDSDGIFALAVLLASGAAILAPVAPLILRADLRQDVKQLDILRAFPLRGWQVVLAELLGPAILVAALQLSLVVSGLVLSAAGQSEIGWGMRLAVAAALALVTPVLACAVLLVQNAAVVLFPAWAAYEPGQRGLEAMGQRMLNLLGTLLVLAVGLLPSGGVAGLVYLLLWWARLPVLGVAIAAAVCALLLALEVAVGIALAGKAFDTLDPSIG